MVDSYHLAELGSQKAYQQVVCSVLAKLFWGCTMVCKLLVTEQNLKVWRWPIRI